MKRMPPGRWEGEGGNEEKEEEMKFACFNTEISHYLILKHLNFYDNDLQAISLRT